MLGPSDHLVVRFRRRVGLQWRRLPHQDQATRHNAKAKRRTYVNQVPRPHRAVLVSADDARFAVPKARADPVGRARVAFEVVEHLASGHVHEADVRVKGRREVSLIVLGRYDRCYRFWGGERMEVSIDD